MKPIFLSILFSICVFNFSIAQTPGEWTWMNGIDNINSLGNYGVKGVPSPTVFPPALYETCEWTDLQGNFWIYGGLFLDSTGSAGGMADLWKYDPVTNEWTWIWGDGQIFQMHDYHYGIQGIPDPLNSPGVRYFGTGTWTDQNNNLWLYGGTGQFYDSIGNYYGGYLADLWKYDITSNM